MHPPSFRSIFRWQSLKRPEQYIRSYSLEMSSGPGCARLTFLQHFPESPLFHFLSSSRPTKPWRDWPGGFVTAHSHCCRGPCRSYRNYLVTQRESWRFFHVLQTTHAHSGLSRMCAVGAPSGTLLNLLTVPLSTTSWLNTLSLCRIFIV